MTDRAHKLFQKLWVTSNFIKWLHIVIITLTSVGLLVIRLNVTTIKSIMSQYVIWAIIGIFGLLIIFLELESWIVMEILGLEIIDD